MVRRTGALDNNIREIVMSRRSTGFTSNPISFLVLLALALLSAASAEAATYAVTSTGNESLVANPDNLCQIAITKSPCTLRAALQLTNSLAGADTIVFALSTSDVNYDAQTGSWTIPLNTFPLPDVSGSLTITGPG